MILNEYPIFFNKKILWFFTHDKAHNLGLHLPCIKLQIRFGKMNKIAFTKLAKE
jgi:hypothetical protein